jgi:hypothetical protein
MFDDQSTKKFRLLGQIRVILYVKGYPLCATATADELPIEDIAGRRARRYPARWGLHVPVGEVYSLGDRVALAEGPGGISGLAQGFYLGGGV